MFFFGWKSGLDLMGLDGLTVSKRPPNAIRIQRGPKRIAGGPGRHPDYWTTETVRYPSASEFGASVEQAICAPGSYKMEVVFKGLFLLIIQNFSEVTYDVITVLTFPIIWVRRYFIGTPWCMRYICAYSSNLNLWV